MISTQRRQKILLVEKDVLVIHEVRDFAQGKRIDVKCIKKNDGILSLLKNEKFDLIVLNVQTPGKLVPGQLKQIPFAYPSLPVIVICNDHQMWLPAEVIDAGIFDCIQHPVDYKRLCSAMDNALRIRMWHDKNMTKLKTAYTDIEKCKIQLESQIEILSHERYRSEGVLGTDYLSKLVNRQNMLLQKENKELEQKVVDLIKMFTFVLDLQDPFWGNHCRRVSFLAKRIAEQCELSEKEIKDIEIAAILHDIGAIGLSKDILIQSFNNEKSKYREEFEKHSIYGETCLEAVAGMKNIAKIVRHHHERFDGSGYPDGLKGENIPLGARIIAIVDEFDFLINGPRAEQRVSIKQAINIINTSQECFDPALLPLFMNIMIFLIKEKCGNTEKIISMNGLQEGMILSRDVFLANGIFVFSKNEILSQEYINRLKNFSKISSIRDGIYIYDDGVR